MYVNIYYIYIILGCCLPIMIPQTNWCSYTPCKASVFKRKMTIAQSAEETDPPWYVWTLQRSMNGNKWSGKLCTCISKYINISIMKVDGILRVQLYIHSMHV